MSGQTRSILLTIASAALSATGCERRSSPPSPADEAEPAKLTLIAPESTGWSQAQAVEYLSEPALAVSAAVRLVHLAEVPPACVPGRMTDTTARRLRVVKLAEGLWALGWADRRGDRAMHAPLLIAADGAVQRVTVGMEEELLVLQVSKDAEVYPHLLIAPGRVWIAASPPKLALTLDSPLGIGFQQQEKDGAAYLALRSYGTHGWADVAKYYWEPFEQNFTGPASDRLPDPPGGKFALDMRASPLLIPQGGEMPAPQPRHPETPPQLRPPWEDA